MRLARVGIFRVRTGRQSRGPMSFIFFFNDTATTEIYTLSLHDALPISHEQSVDSQWAAKVKTHTISRIRLDRKSTRLNSSHSQISYAVFCLKKKKTKRTPRLVTIQLRTTTSTSRPYYTKRGIASATPAS